MSLDFLGSTLDTCTMKISNCFTLMRFCFAPVFFLLYFIPVWTHSVLLGKISAFVMIPLLAVFEFTDYLDGHYARKNGEVSDFGKLFDPFADVMLNLTVFFCGLFSSWRSGGYMPLIILLLIMYREFSMNFLRMIAMKNGVAIAARKGGKFKTVFYIISGFYMLALESACRLGIALPVDVAFFHIGAVCMFTVCLVLSYASFIDYLIHFIPVVKHDI